MEQDPELAREMLAKEREGGGGGWLEKEEEEDGNEEVEEREVESSRRPLRSTQSITLMAITGVGCPS